MARLRERQEWHLVRALWRADRRLAALWWGLLVLRGVLPAVFAVVMGVSLILIKMGRTAAW